MKVLSNRKYTLKELRKIFRVQATWLANQLGISRQQYYKLENKSTPIYLDMRLKIANVYNISVDSIDF